MDEATRELLREVGRGQLPQAVPTTGEYASELQALVEHLAEVQRMAAALASGDLSMQPKRWKGPVLGSLKALQSNLRHLTWQTQQIAAGDFSQRVDFLGEFSRAFNHMVEQLSRSRDELVHTSTHDALTGLFNRAFFDAELDRLARGRAFPVSVIVVDLDGLKAINDTLGHEAGDALIMKAATVLQGSFRAEDVVARVGGDEFTVLLPGVDEATGRRVLQRLAERTEAANQHANEPSVSMSVGIATASGGSALRVAQKLADERMYADKTARKAGRAG